MENKNVRVAVAVGADGAALTCELVDDGTSRANPVVHKDLLTAVTATELAGPVRWVWASTARVYPELLRAGRRVDRCHDLELIERLLTSRDGEVSE